ncbi:hypothetical protein [Methylobacillus sp.]|uniref:hypothetical protein n=1 Tax=Methylobacillus sp. TaxID=56818 RepID=UPI0012C2CF25|nr:hypothetical protein [Methylobacillus sp.]MPS48575.1 hypothetical protein [Methylobacillus sp.]
MATITLPPDLIEDIRATHPFPWRHVLHPNGQIQVGDANNREVDIFLMVRVCEQVGHLVAKEQANVS